MDKLLSFIDKTNIAEDLEDEELGRIGSDVVKGYEIDKGSRDDWEKKHQKAMDLAMQVQEDKSYPWPGASNIKYPLVATAAIQFNARAYPAIIQGRNIVKGAVTGEDENGEKQARASRIETHMNYQLLEEMEEWELDVDKMLLQLPIVGCAFKKTYYDNILGRNVSELVPAKYLIVNHKAKSLESAPRITMEFTLYPHEVTERIRAGTYRDADLPSPEGEDEEGPMEFLEQHRLLDLDDDDYPEPYIVTVHKQTSKVVRIVARFEPDGIIINRDREIVKIEPDQYFTKYGFIPNPDGGFYDIGLGMLLNPLSESIDTTLNQLMDAGHLANTQGGFIGRGSGMKKGEIRLRPGEFKPLNVPGGQIRDSIVPMNFPEPSAVLFQLLGLLIDAAKDISSVNETMTGNANTMSQPTALMQMIEQGQQVFSAIFKRIHRSLKYELKKIARLNKYYLPDQEYFNVLDQQNVIAREDYEYEDCDVHPVSDPTVVTNTQKLGQAQFLMQFMADPLMNPIEIRMRVLRAANIEDPEKLIAPPQPQGPDPQMLLEMAKMQLDKAKLDNEARETNSKIINNIADALYSLERAEAENAGTQIEYYKTQLMGMIQFMGKLNEADRVNGGGVQGMAGQSNNPGVSPVPQGLPPEQTGGFGLG